MEKAEVDREYPRLESGGRRLTDVRGDMEGGRHDTLPHLIVELPRDSDDGYKRVSTISKQIARIEREV